LNSIRSEVIFSVTGACLDLDPMFAEKAWVVRFTYASDSVTRVTIFDDSDSTGVTMTTR